MAETNFITWIMQLRKALRREFEEQAAALDITASQMQVLKRLWIGDGIATSVLTQEAGSDGGTVTGVLDRLECRGLIRRERSTQDRRSVQIWLTPEGRALEKPLKDIVAAINQQALEGLSEEQKLLLMQTLEKVGRNLNE
jgi:DNA-binding MarR family transcriptional regulator